MWVTRKELVEDLGARVAEKLWDFSCFLGVYKSFHEFPEPVSQAHAMATWMNQGWSRVAALNWWKSAPNVIAPKRVEQDENSRDRMRRRLLEILPE